MRKLLVPAVAAVLSLLSGAATACVLGALYNLPIPFGMYASGASAALVASFVIVAYVLKSEPARSTLPGPGARDGEALQLRLSRQLVGAAAWVSVGCLLLTVATGLFGTQNILANPGMTLFWIVFSLGMTYATALVGDVYSLINPWRKLCDWIERFDSVAFRGRIRYPVRLAYYPALVLYMSFIWIELFGEIEPRTLSAILLLYTGLNLGAAWLFGKEHWFRYGEFFSVFFRLVGKIAPITYVQTRDDDGYVVRLRKPFMALLDAHADHVSLLLFVVFMLSATAFDGVHSTQPWVGLFWKHIYPLLAAGFDESYFFFLNIYYAWQWAMLFLSPFVYLAVYLLLIWLAKLVASSEIPLRALALRFAFTLIPIAFVYNMTHYYGELVSQGVQMVRMISDPFGLGWNLFGTNGLFVDTITLDAGAVWHTQVALILFGHIVSVYLAHVEALKAFPNRRYAALSQAPMLVLMVLLTTVGLWILSLPIDAGQVVTPAPA